MSSYTKFIFLSCISILISTAYSHGGGLNSHSCHNQNSNSTYHCHGGNYDGQSFASEQAFFDFIDSSNGSSSGSGSGSEDNDGNALNSTYDRDEKYTNRNG